MNTRDAYNLNCVEPMYRFAPRIPAIQAMNGSRITTPATVDMAKLTDSIGTTARDFLVWLFSENNLDLKACILSGKVGEKNLGKWLIHSHIPESLVSKICAAKVAGTEFTVSTRYKDFARMSLISTIPADKLPCSRVGGTKPKTISYYLKKPNVFLLVRRDPKGKFLNRVIARLTIPCTNADAEALRVSRGDKIILFNRVYGPHADLPDTLQLPTNKPGIFESVPCFQQPHQDDDNPDIRWITIATVCYEPDTKQARYPDDDEIYDDLYQRHIVIVKPKT